VRRITLPLAALTVLAGSVLHAQGQPPTNGPVYWSTTQPDCSSLFENPVTITNTSGATIGYSCYVSGTFIWLAAGAGWGSAIRVAAPSTAPVGVDYTFYDPKGNPISLDTSGAVTASTKEVAFGLNINQPAEVDLRGNAGNGPNYSSLAIGSIYAVFYCPDANTCANVVPQLIYSNLPTNPWSLSVPIAWDGSEWTQWAAEGVDDGGTHEVSFVVYNQDKTATTYTINVYDSTGKLVGTGTTPSIPPLQDLGNGNIGQGGTYGAQLRALVPSLPSGTFKVLFNGGSLNSFVEVLQFTGPSATTLQVATDGSSTASTGAMTRSAVAGFQPNIKKQRVESTPKMVFPGLTR
jgi:hypothetical protein